MVTPVGFQLRAKAPRHAGVIGTRSTTINPIGTEPKHPSPPQTLSPPAKAPEPPIMRYSSTTIRGPRTARRLGSLPTLRNRGRPTACPTRLSPGKRTHPADRPERVSWPSMARSCCVHPLRIAFERRDMPAPLGATLQGDLGMPHACPDDDRLGGRLALPVNAEWTRSASVPVTRGAP